MKLGFRAAGATVVLAMCTGLVDGGLRAGSWPTYHGDYALTGVSPDNQKELPVRLWRVRVGTGCISPVVGGDGRLFCVADGTVITALDVKGAKLWTRTVKRAAALPEGDPVNERFVAPPLYIREKMLVVAAKSGRVYGLSLSDGKLKWSYASGGEIQSTPNYAPGASGEPDRIFVMTREEGILHAVNPVDGSRLWVSAPMARTDGHIAVADGNVVFGNCAASFFAVEVASGKGVAVIEVGEACEMAGGVAISGDRVFGGNRSGSFACADLKKQALCWANKDGTGELFTTPAVTERHVVFCSGDAVVHCLDPVTGKKVWAYETGGVTALGPLIAGDGVLAAVDGALSCLALTDGVLRWKLDIGDEITDPAIVDGMIVVGTDDGNVAAYGRL